VSENHPLNAERTYSLQEAAHIICGADDPATLHWLAQRLRGNSTPVLSGYKVARRWRMTESDVQAAIDALRPRRVQIPAMTSMTSRSQRRLAVS
jgi:hypothetical protein